MTFLFKAAAVFKNPWVRVIAYAAVLLLILLTYNYKPPRFIYQEF